MTPSTVVEALAAALRSAPGRPLLTTYDETTGQRVELSVATFDNWVCKLANLLGAEWELEPGALVSIRLPTHWQSAAVTMAAWTAGLAVTFEVTTAAAVSLARWEDFAAEVPGQPDQLVMPADVSSETDALVVGPRVRSHGELVSRGLSAAEAIGLGHGGRLLTDLDPASESGLDVALLAPLITGSSVVLVVGATPERFDRIAEQERVTCRHQLTA